MAYSDEEEGLKIILVKKEKKKKNNKRNLISLNPNHVHHSTDNLATGPPGKSKKQSC